MKIETCDPLDETTIVIVSPIPLLLAPDFEDDQPTVEIPADSMLAIVEGLTNAESDGIPVAVGRERASQLGSALKAAP